MTTNVIIPCFTTQHQTSKTKTKTKTDFLVSDRSCPKTDGLRPHHCLGIARPTGILWLPGKLPNWPRHIISLKSVLDQSRSSTLWTQPRWYNDVGVLSRMPCRRKTHQVTHQVRPHLFQWTGKALGPSGSISPWSPSESSESFVNCSWRSWCWVNNRRHAEVAYSIGPTNALTDKKWCLWSRRQRCFSNLTKCPVVLVTWLKLKKLLTGVDTRPSYILKTSSRSARWRLSSSDHSPRYTSLPLCDMKKKKKKKKSDTFISFFLMCIMYVYFCVSLFLFRVLL